MATPVTFDATLTVNELLQLFPAAIETLSRYGIDTCCRGSQSIARAAVSAGVDPERLLTEVAIAKPTAPVKSCACGCRDSEGAAV
jgi:regulator of cell morphogenesis and NO signaling